MGKRDHHIVIEEKIMKAFRACIIDKTGDLKKGDLSKWFEISINGFILQNKQQQQHTTYDMQLSVEEEMIITLTDLMKEMTKLLWNDSHPTDITCGNSCHKRTLYYAISNVKNVHDARTIKKWIARLVEFEFIRQVKKDWYRILNDGNNSVEIEPKQTEPIKKEDLK